MKKLLLSTVALATMTAGAMAADLPARRMAPAPFAAVPVFTWTGFYVGVNVGAAWNGNRGNNFGFNNALFSPGGVPVVDATGNNFGAGGLIGGGNRNRTSILGGVQAGYNWQTGALVIGVEGDIQAIGNSRRNNGFGFGGFGTNGFGTAVVTGPAAAVGDGVAPATAAAFPNNVAFFNNGGGAFGADGRGSNWFATARVRIGFAVDRALFYVTGGAAFTDSRNRSDGFFGGTGFAGGAAVPAGFYTNPGAVVAGAGVAPTATFIGNNDRNNIGWALGLGMEYAFTNNLSAKIEYLHLGFDGNRNNAFAGTRVVGVTNTGGAITTTGGFNNRQRNNVDLVRVGLNFRFSGL